MAFAVEEFGTVRCVRRRAWRKSSGSAAPCGGAVLSADCNAIVAGVPAGAMLALCHDRLPQLISGFRQHVTGGVQSQHPLAVKEISRHDAIARRDRVDRTAAYSELRLAPGAGGEAVRAAYRSLAKQHHPDIPGGDAGRFQRLKQARDLLLAGSDPAPARPAQEARRGSDMTAEVEVSLEVVMTGGRVPVAGAGGVCRVCQGTGTASTAAIPCGICGGSGQTRVAKGIVRVHVPCRGCGGTGRITACACGACGGSDHGSGQPPEVYVPPGLPDGTVIRIAGSGGPGSGGGPRGDLAVVVRSAPHARFRRNGADLITTVKVPFTDLCLGGTAAVEPLGGGHPLSVRFAPGTQAGAVLALDGRGLPGASGGRHGGLFVRLLPSVPGRVTPRQADLLRRWRSEEATTA